jgi:WD40 repeat protein
MVRTVAFSPDGKHLASASCVGRIKMWNPQSYAVQQTLRYNSSSIEAVAFSPDGKLLASASDDSTVKLWGASIRPVDPSIAYMP